MFYSIPEWDRPLFFLGLLFLSLCTACDSFSEDDKQGSSFYSRNLLFSDYLYEKPVSRPDGWKVDSILQENKAEELVNSFLADTSLGLKGVLLSRHGSLILEEYKPSWPSDSLMPLAENELLLISTLTGIVQQQEMELVQRSVKLPTVSHAQRFPVSDTTVTLMNLLRMDTNLLCRPQQQVIRDLAQKSHGGGFYYCPANYRAVADWLEIHLNEPLSFYAEEKLFEPLVIDRYRWEEEEISMSARDVLKLAALHAQNGRWNQEQVLPDSWVLRLKSRAYEKETQGQFAWGWWQEKMLVNGRQYAVFYSKGPNYLLMLVPDLYAGILLTGNLKRPAADYFPLLKEQAIPVFEKK